MARRASDRSIQRRPYRRRSRQAATAPGPAKGHFGLHGIRERLKSFKGALVKTSSQAAILDAIRDVAAGKRVFGEGVVLPQAEKQDDPRLTKRQCEILSLAAHGLTSRDIAATLGIAYETVKDNPKKIFLALDASTRAEAVSKAIGETIISVRLEEVKRLLRETNEPIDMVAAHCGYENPNYLKNLFKRRFAMTMREFRVRA